MHFSFKLCLTYVLQSHIFIYGEVQTVSVKCKTLSLLNMLTCEQSTSSLLYHLGSHNDCHIHRSNQNTAIVQALFWYVRKIWVIFELKRTPTCGHKVTQYSQPGWVRAAGFVSFLPVPCPGSVRLYAASHSLVSRPCRVVTRAGKNKDALLIIGYMDQSLQQHICRYYPPINHTLFFC